MGPDPLHLRDDWYGLSTEPFRSFDRRADLEACGSHREVARLRLRAARHDGSPERAEPSNTRPAAAVRRSHAANHELPDAVRELHNEVAESVRTTPSAREPEVGR